MTRSRLHRHRRHVHERAYASPHRHLPFALATSRATNDEIADMVRTWPKRFAGLGTVPMQDIDLAIKEMERCVKELRMPGLGINCARPSS